VSELEALFEALKLDVDGLFMQVRPVTSGRKLHRLAMLSAIALDAMNMSVAACQQL
jgi:hypothetical protein